MIYHRSSDDEEWKPFMMYPFEKPLTSVEEELYKKSVIKKYDQSISYFLAFDMMDEAMKDCYHNFISEFVQKKE